MVPSDIKPRQRIVDAQLFDELLTNFLNLVISYIYIVDIVVKLQSLAELFHQSRPEAVILQVNLLNPHLIDFRVIAVSGPKVQRPFDLISHLRLILNDLADDVPVPLAVLDLVVAQVKQVQRLVLREAPLKLVKRILGDIAHVYLQSFEGLVH